MEWDTDDLELVRRVVRDASFYGLFELSEAMVKWLILSGRPPLGLSPPWSEVLTLKPSLDGNGLRYFCEYDYEVGTAVFTVSVLRAWSKELFELPKPREVLPGFFCLSQARLRMLEKFAQASGWLAKTFSRDFASAHPKVVALLNTLKK